MKLHHDFLEIEVRDKLKLRPYIASMLWLRKSVVCNLSYLKVFKPQGWDLQKALTLKYNHFVSYLNVLSQIRVSHLKPWINVKDFFQNYD